jgi:3-oxoadipate enol-lactonase
MATAELGEVSIHYQIAGDAGLPVLVLSHALGVNMAMWEPQVEAFSVHFRLLSYDVRGHGQSSIPSGPYSVEDLGRDVLKLLDALEIQQVSFCGVSMGGLIGQWLGIHASSRIQNLILASSAAKIGTAESWNARITAVAEGGLAPLIPATLERWLNADYRSSHPESTAAIGTMLQSANLRGYSASCAAVRDADFRAELSAIHAPTLVISGSYDPSTTPTDGRFLAEHTPGARFVELPAAHLCNVDAAAEFNTVVLDFLRN